MVITFLNMRAYAYVITLRNGKTHEGEVIAQKEGYVYYKKNGKTLKVAEAYIKSVQLDENIGKQEERTIQSNTLDPVTRNIARGDFGIGLNYPGLSLRYFLFNRLSVEIKGQYEKDISVGGIRMNYYLKRQGVVLLFAGVEGDYVSFEGDTSKGNGYVGEIYVGGETFMARRLSLQLDIGPAFIQLKDKDTKLKEDGVEVVANIGINYYFGK